MDSAEDLLLVSEGCDSVSEEFMDDDDDDDGCSMFSRALIQVFLPNLVGGIMMKCWFIAELDLKVKFCLQYSQSMVNECLPASMWRLSSELLENFSLHSGHWKYFRSWCTSLKCLSRLRNEVNWMSHMLHFPIPSCTIDKCSFSFSFRINVFVHLGQDCSSWFEWHSFICLFLFFLAENFFLQMEQIKSWFSVCPDRHFGESDDFDSEKNRTKNQTSWLH